MPFNGNGVFSVVYNFTNEAANGIKILASRQDTQWADIATNGLSVCITKDGQQIITADIPWNHHKITGLASPTVTGDALSYGNIATLSTTTFLGVVTSIGAAASNYNSIIAQGTTTGANWWSLINTTGQALFGVDSSAGGTLATGSGAYATVVGSQANRDFDLISNGVVRFTIGASGLFGFNGAVGTATITINAPAAANINSINAVGTTTAANYWKLTNTGAIAILGADSSAGGQLATGTGVYATVIGNGGNHELDLITNNITRVVVSAAGAVQMNTYGAGTATFDASGNITSVSDPSQKFIVGAYKDGLAAIVATASDEFMGLHKWRPESGNETEGTYASFFARDNFPISGAVSKNANGINSFSDRPVIMALVNAVATLAERMTAIDGKAS